MMPRFVGTGVSSHMLSLWWTTTLLGCHYEKVSTGLVELRLLQRAQTEHLTAYPVLPVSGKAGVIGLLPLSLSRFC